MKKNQSIYKKAQDIFRGARGFLRTADAIRAGIHPRTLYEMRDRGMIERLSRGLYRLSDLPQLTEPDIIAVAMKAPESVLCLISALAFYEMTTQIPHEVHIAIGRNSRPPRIDYPPVRVFRFSGKAFTEGVETHKIDGVSIQVYSIEKTLADCFKYRHKIGIDTAIESLKLYRKSKHVRYDLLMYFAKICRVVKIMRPYVESVIFG
jgi:predicted transcriptional regulator of viral defense system